MNDCDGVMVVEKICGTLALALTALILGCTSDTEKPFSMPPNAGQKAQDGPFSQEQVFLAKVAAAIPGGAGSLPELGRMTPFGLSMPRVLLDFRADVNVGANDGGVVLETCLQRNILGAVASRLANDNFCSVANVRGFARADSLEVVCVTPTSDNYNDCAHVYLASIWIERIGTSTENYSLLLNASFRVICEDAVGSVGSFGVARMSAADGYRINGRMATLFNACEGR